MTLWIKICGNTSLADAQLAADAGANAVGFVFAPSPRRVTVAQVAAIVPHLPPALEKIGVFVDASFAEIASTVESCALTGVQLHFDAPPALPAQLRVRFGPHLRILRVAHFDAQISADLKGSGFSPHINGPESERALERNPSDSAHLEGVQGGFYFHPCDEDQSQGTPEMKKPLEGRASGYTCSDSALAPEAYFSDPNIDAILVDSRTATAPGGTGKTFDWTLAATSLFQNAKARERRLVAAGGLTPDNVAEAIATLHPWGVDVVSGVESALGRKDPAKVRAFIVNARAVINLCKTGDV